MGVGVTPTALFGSPLCASSECGGAAPVMRIEGGQNTAPPLNLPPPKSPGPQRWIPLLPCTCY